MTFRAVAWRGLTYLALVVVTIAMIVPFLWMVSTSLKPADQLFSVPPKWLPRPVDASGYIELWKIAPFARYYLNSVKITGSVLLGVTFFCSLAGYGFARIKFPGSSILFSVLLVSLMIPYTATMIPLYIIYRTVGWIDSHWPLIVPPIFSGAYATFFFRQYFLTIPLDLEDAAKMEGCNNFAIYWRIMVPLAKPIIGAVIIFTFLSNWNEFLGPLIYINTRELQTLPVGLALFRGEFSTNWTVLMSAAVLATIPILVVYAASQRFFIKGIVMTGIK
jgi:multiple sugar transport system permease protein